MGTKACEGYRLLSGVFEMPPLSLNLELTNWLHWLASKLGIILSAYPALELQALTTVLSLCVWRGTEDPSSGPRACTHILHQPRHCPSPRCHIFSSICKVSALPY